MKLPNYHEAEVSRQKITDYLLSLTHPDGQSKADFFLRFGFAPVAWEEMAEALKQHAAEHEVRKVEPSPFGIRYVIDGTVETPDRRNPLIRTVWFIETGETLPRFVTAYPSRSER